MNAKKKWNLVANVSPSPTTCTEFKKRFCETFDVLVVICKFCKVQNRFCRNSLYQVSDD